MTSTDDSSLAAILAPSVAASNLIKSLLMPRLTRPPPESAGPRSGLRPTSAPRQRLLLRQSRLDDVGPGDVHVPAAPGSLRADRRQWVVGGLDTGHVDGLDLTDVLEDGAELAGEAFQLVVGQGESRQAGEVGYLVSGDLRHDYRSLVKRHPAVSAPSTSLPASGRRRSAEPVRRETVLRVPSYLLRVQLEDRPGSLGSLAVALGSVGADILSLDVVERGAGLRRSTTWSSNCPPARCPTC